MVDKFILFRLLVNIILRDVQKGSVRKQPTFRAATTGYSAKQRLRNEHKNSILVTFTGCLDLGFASDWLKNISLATNKEALPRSG